MKTDTIKIDTVPLPEKPVSLEIPMKILQEFIKEPRIVIRHPWVVGLPVPEVFLKRLIEDPGFYKEITKKCEIMLVPKQAM